MLGTEDEEFETVRACKNDPCSPSGLLPIVSSCVLFFITGPCLIMVNKHILVDLDFPFPMMLSSVGLLSSTVILQILRLVGVLALEKTVSYEIFLKRIFPIGLFQALTLKFGNQSYLYMDVSLLQMLKAISPVLTLVLLWIARLAVPNISIVFCIALITLGTVMSTISSEITTWSKFGFLVAFFTELFESLKLVLVHFLLTEKGLRFGVMEGLAYFAPTALGWMIILISMLELPKFVSSGAVAIVNQNWLIFQSCFVLGFLANVAGFLVIKTTSVVTLKIIAQIRNLGLILFNVTLYKEVVTQNQWIGYMITMLGFACYYYVSLRLIKR